MKHNYHKIALIAVLCFGISLPSCKKSFLETIPKGKLVPVTTSDFSGLLSNTFIEQIGNVNVQVPMGDEVAAVDPYFSAATLKAQRAFRYEAVIYDATADADETLTPLKNIYNFNVVINGVPGSTGGTDAQKLSVEASARAGRAWTYFLFINYYGKPYNATTAATDPGFPIITAADVTETKFTRASVQAVYDFIISDLTTAIPNLPVQVSNRMLMSKSAAEAILGKVYMFMGRYADALNMLNASITDMANLSIPARLYDYNVEFAAGGVFNPVSPIFGPPAILLPNNVQSVYAKSITIPWTYTANEIVISPQTAALYGSTDLRLKFFTPATFSTMTPYPVAGLMRKWGSSQVPIGVLVPDLYLLRAEAKCRTGDLPGAKADVETLRVKRMPAADAPVPAATSADKMLLLQFILNERIREYAAEGERWFDMRRLSVDPLFQGITFTHPLYSATGAITQYPLPAVRLTLQIPQKLIDQNPGMVQNP